MVAVSTVKMEDGKVSCATPEGTVINVNITQRSCLDSILDATKNVRIVKKGGTSNLPATRASAGYLGVGVSLMSMGLISVMLAIIFAVARLDVMLQYYGTHFWVGFPFLVAGVLNVLAYRYPKKCWEVIAFISLLVCLGVSIAGIVYSSGDINSFGWRIGNMQSLCDRVRQTQERNYYYQTAPPRYNGYGDYDYRLENCKRGFQEYMNLLFGVIIMSLLIMIWGVCVSAITLAYRLKGICNSCRCEKVEENDDPMLPPTPASDIIIA